MFRPVVATVCYRWKNKKFELLLVRTRSGRHWTFPKGHVETGLHELAWAAAEREAREEAGVKGKIQKEPFTSYEYSGGKKRRAQAAAYLLSVESLIEPQEPNRNPQWFTSELAVEKLAEGRQRERYVREQQRVVREALAILSAETLTSDPRKIML